MDSNGSQTPSSNSNCSNVTGQPQTKRQKIEKFKSNGRSTKTSQTIATSPSSSKSPPPDITDTGETINQNVSNTLCSSLSSSANSISIPSSSNNSPTSTPSSSRATSFSQLLNVQNIITSTLSSSGNTTSSNNSADSSCRTSDCSSGSSSSEQSADEVDRVALPYLLQISDHHALKTRSSATQPTVIAEESRTAQDMREFEESLTKQCLCGVSENTLHKPFQSHYSVDANGQMRIANLNEWPTNKLLQFLSNLQLLFDIYLKQNSKGSICARIMDVCDALIRNDHNLIDEIIVLAGYSNAYVQFLAGRVLASFLVIAKQEMNDDWLKKLVDNLFNFNRLDHIAVQKIHFSLDIIKRIVEWKDVDLHPHEDEIPDNQDMIDTTGLGATAINSSLESHAYLHFHTQQPTLETNYFAIHFHSSAEDHIDRQEHGETEDKRSTSVHKQTHRHDMTQMQNFHNVNNLNAPDQMSNDFSLSHSSRSSEEFPTSSSQLSIYHRESNDITYTNTNFNSIGHFITPEVCTIVTLTDSESFDTTHLKCITIKILENKWPAFVRNMSELIANHLDIENAENCILNFLQLWENIISVKANLSIVETLPFYAQLDKFELLLNQNLSCTVYKHMLCLFNEALCYGSTLALQDMLPNETCQLAHQIVRHVKDYRILESLPRRQPENIVSLIGFKRRPVIYENGSLQTNTCSITGGDVIEMDKTILQKMVLLVLKSIAVTVKEIRSDSSDSSIDSTDYDAFQDMMLIERSIRDALSKLESFIKHTLEFHPECHFSKILIHLFDDQDDHLIEAMVCTLDVTAGISFRNNAFPELVSMLNPVYTFLEFLKMISNSLDLLIDLLISNETCFLLYLLRFLKFIRMNWPMFVQSCYEFSRDYTTIDDAMTILTRLRLKISRLVSQQLYPYDISPILRLLENCETLYEGNELS